MRASRFLGALALFLSGTVVSAETLPFATASAEARTVQREQVVNAVIEAVNRATVSAETGGRVVEVNFDVDDYVPKGSVLLRLRDTDQRAAFDAAKARFDEAQSDFRRMQDLLERKLVSKSAFEKAESTLRSTRAAFEQAREQLDHTVVRAPYSGIVVERHIEPGEIANPGQPLMTGISLEKLRAVAEVPQVYIGTVRELGQARVILPREGKSLEGVSINVSPYADPKSHTFRVRVDLPDGEHGVYPGMYAEVGFPIGEVTRLLVPGQAVAYRSEVTAVYVVNGEGGIAFRQIRVGRTLPGGEVEVLAGLSEGEVVALDPVAAAVYLKERR